MPSTRISTGEWASGQEATVIDAVQGALLTSLKIPDWDRDIVLDLYGGSNRIVPTGRSERFTRVEIAMFSGRSIDMKRTLYRSIVEALAALGVPELDVRVVLVESPADNWSIRGGVPASEVDPGSRMDV